MTSAEAGIAEQAIQLSEPRRDWTRWINDQSIAAHQRWLDADRIGPGRLVIEHADLRDAIIPWSLPASRFVDCDLSDAWARVDSLRRAELIGSVLDGAWLDGTHLDGARIERCSAQRVRFQFARFRGAVIRGGDWSWSDLDRARFDGARLHGVRLAACVLTDAILDGARLVGCDLRRADLRRTRPRLGMGSAHGARFERCDLRGARLDGWRLRDTTLVGCALAGARGAPLLEGTVRIVAPDLSEDFDGSRVVDGATLLDSWRAQAGVG